ncbi:MAG: hypothetical protein RLY76_56 [Actinomycetota bacterium]
MLSLGKVYTLAVSDIIGAIAGIALVVGIYWYYGRKVLRWFISAAGIKRQRKYQQDMDMVNQVDMDDFAVWLKEKLKEEKRKDKDS